MLVNKRLSLITNRKWYTGFRLALNSMTLDNLERQNRDFLWIFRAISSCDTKSLTRWHHSTGVGGMASLVTRFGCN